MTVRTFDEFCTLTGSDRKYVEHFEDDAPRYWWSDESEDDWTREVEDVLHRPVDVEDLAAFL